MERKVKSIFYLPGLSGWPSTIGCSIISGSTAALHKVYNRKGL